MKQYQFSKQYRLTSPEEIADSGTKTTTQLKQSPLYGLFDTASGECVLINSTVHLFLKEYETPKTLVEVASVFAKSFDSTEEDVLPIISQFFNEMHQRGVLIAPKSVKNFDIIEPYAVGTLIDGYRIEENLSINLPLEVYKATDTRTEQPVILKMLRIPPHLPEKKRTVWREKFKKEFTVQKILRGLPNICQILNLTPDYAVLEWIEGVSLNRHLTEKKALGGRPLNDLWQQIMVAYAAMHSKNILHGDIHAHNILVVNGDSVKIIDFDLAHLLTNPRSFPQSRGGVPEFIAPENIQFDAFTIVKGKATYRTEVYQLGILAYWMTYGKMPFVGDTWQDLATDILNKPIDFPDVNTIGKKISPEEKLFLEKSLAKNPRKRFASAEEMLSYFKEKVGN
jgi:serine/threonine protein kinase